MYRKYPPPPRTKRPARMMSTICQAFSFFDSSSLRGRTYDGAVVKSRDAGAGAGASGIGGALMDGRPLTDIGGGADTSGNPVTAAAIKLD